MKTKVAFLFLLAIAAFSAAVAQTREDDDMYFTSKDRAIMNAALQKDRQEIFASSNVRRITESETASTINPTDSYSARNVNPEYISGSKVGSNTGATAQYFSPNYQPTAVNQNLPGNYNNLNSYNYNGFSNGFNNGFGYSPYNRFGMSGMYGMGGYGMMSPFGYGNYGMMNPYYGYDPFMRGNGFYGSGFSMGFGYGMGGFGNGFYGNPYGMSSFYGGYGYNPFYNPYSFGYGSSYYGYGSNYNTVVVVDRPRPNSARGEEIDRYYNSNGNRGGGNTGGRVASTDNSQQYYNRAWRNDAATPERGSTTWNNTRSYQQSYNGWNDNNTRSNWGGSNGGFNNSGFSGGRSSGGFSGGGAAPSGGGGGGARRGRD